jgi:exodeoxyribonuclease-5
LADIETDNDNFISIPIDLTALTTGKKSFTSQEEFYIYKDKRNTFPPPIEFNYGYAITCHRAQGSQWDKVLVQEERFPFDKEEHARWLYTAVTRAAQKLVLILK